jgi:cytochrome P450
MPQPKNADQPEKYHDVESDHPLESSQPLENQPVELTSTESGYGTDLKAPPAPHLRARELLRDPLNFFLTLTRDYGDVVCYRSAPEPAYLINHPDLVKQILVDNNRNYTKETYTNRAFKAVVSDGLLTSEGEVWRKQRRLMQPAFHQQRLAKFDAVITDATEVMLDHWQELFELHEPVYIAREMAALTLTITTHILFGVDLGEDINLVGIAMDKGLALIEKPTHPDFIESLQIIDGIVKRIIAERRQAPDETNDLLSILLHAQDEDTGEMMNDQQLRDQVFTLLLAGYETTASALTWAWYLLSQNSEIVQQIREEVEGVLQDRTPTYADTLDLEYTLCVFKEVLRLYPSAWVLGRKAINADRLGEYLIPADGTLAISPYTLHRHLEFWDQPDIFDPSRFLPEASAHRHRFAYIPFGGGPRQCIGNNLALLEAQLIISMVVRRFTLHLIDDHPIKPSAHFVLRPDRNILMELEAV